MSFESKSFKESGASAEKKSSPLQFLKESVDRLKSPKAGKFVRRIGVLMSALGVLGTTEALAQGREQIDRLVSATRETVTALDSAVRANPDRRLRININGRESEAFERTVEGRKVHSNDFYIYIREENPEPHGGPRTTFTVDIGKDGIPDQMVVVPGNVNRADEAFIVNGFTDRDARRLATEAQLSDMSRQLNDRPALHRTVFVSDQASHRWQIVNFEDGSVRESPDQIAPQTSWATSSAETMDRFKQGIR